MDDGAFTSVVSDGGASTETGLALGRVVGLSVGDTVTVFTRMLVAAALFLGTSTSLYRQSTALFQALDIHLKVILYELI